MTKINNMAETKKPQLVLASSSPRRRALLSQAGFEFIVVDPPLDEPNDDRENLSPAQQAEALAYFKARTVADSYPDDYVLGADTIVALADCTGKNRPQILGKPTDRTHARQILASLSGTRHEVITGVALLGPAGRRKIASEITHVTMRQMTEGEIDDYIESGEWIGKAGAYAIQETADKFVQTIEGSFSNIVGLPMELVTRMRDDLSR